MTSKLKALLTVVAFLACGMNAPHALARQVLDVNKIAAMISDSFPEWVSSPLWQVKWVDRYYRMTSLAEMKAIAKKCSLVARRLRGVGETADCDDQAILFKSKLIRIAARSMANPIPAGYCMMTDDTRSGTHAMIWFVDDAMELYLIEPITGEIKHHSEFPGLRVFFMMG
jgi:hypothetical protein